jgi:hypothetical protein
MLSREEAQARLDAFKVPNWEQKRVASARKLPAKLVQTTLTFLDRDKAGKPWGPYSWREKNEAQTKAIQHLGQMSASDRGKIFALLYPNLASQLENTWQLLGRTPYQTGYSRRAFRAPGDEHIYQEARAKWACALFSQLKGFDPTPVWCAAWAPYIGSGYGGNLLGYLLAAVIDAGGPEGDEVFATLLDSGRNEHEIGAMGRHVTRALLVASRPDGWEFVEKLLLAAQRQEGLRQVILESIDEAHPQAFRRMLRLILDENLIRFSATVRAVDVWFGLQWESASLGVIRSAVEQTLRFLEDPASREEQLKTGKGENLFLALWTLGFEDANQAIPRAAALLNDAVVERRYLAVHFLSCLRLPRARKALWPCLDDDDLRIALHALHAVNAEDEGCDLFPALERLLARMPEKSRELTPLVWPWATVSADRQWVAGELRGHLGKRPATALIPHIRAMASWTRGWLVTQLAEQKTWDTATRDTLFALAGDSTEWVREKALSALQKCSASPEEIQRLEGYLSRTSIGLRRGVVGLLLKQKNPEALQSAERLLASRKTGQRLAGLELLRHLVEAKRSRTACQQQAESYRQRLKAPSTEEEVQLQAILHPEAVPTLDNALGLMDPADRSKPIEPRALEVACLTPATLECLRSLHALVAQNQELAITISNDQGTREVLLGNVRSWGLPHPRLELPLEEDARRFPLRELAEQWLADRSKKMKDRDGLELLRAHCWVGINEESWRSQRSAFGSAWKNWFERISGGVTPITLPTVNVQMGEIVSWLLHWLLRLHPPEGGVDFLLDALETCFALTPKSARTRIVDVTNYQARQADWRCNSPTQHWLHQVNASHRLLPEQWQPEQRLRMWRLMHWRDQPAPGVARFRPDLEYLLEGFRAGEATEADVLDQLLGPPGQSSDLQTLTGPRYFQDTSEDARLGDLLNRCRDRILDIERKRGESPTAATQPARALRSVWGLDRMLDLLAALGKKPLARTSSYGRSSSRGDVLGHLIAVCFPGPEDDPATFASRTKTAGLSKERLVELGFLAPQWLEHIEHTLRWPGFREGVWWFLAHMPYGRPGIVDTRPPQAGSSPGESPWDKIIAERTTLKSTEIDEGMVDVAWFHRAYEPLGRKRWLALAAASRYGCSDNSHKKACLLSDVLLGRAKKANLLRDIRVRQLRDPVRLLGLLPLARGEKREADLVQRYRALHDYRRYARSLGPMSREGALRTYTIGLENLARTAGYPDPMRMEWALEAREVADLAGGPISVTHQGVTVTLDLDSLGQPTYAVARGEKPLKSLPPAVRKDPAVSNLQGRRLELKRQASRMRETLELMMCREDPLTAEELPNLWAHPVLRPVLERLVFLGEGIAGYPTAEGRGLRDHQGKVEPIKPGETLRIAHGHDLLTRKDWHDWQHECFQAERIQPFKQVFRELYVLTAQEKSEGNISHRYAGHQINPRQALALFGSRGWETREEIRRTFYHLGLSAAVSFQDHGWTPLEVEGLTLDAVTFHRQGEWKRLPLKEVPGIVFSEVMRDLDLVVSVAHRGGVDPEASASTVEMRTSLLRETCALLKIDNYRFQKSHVLIDGHLGKYTVHLGSGVVHRQPGGAICIIPIHAQHRGRIFLPFADEDPRTAEVLSKVILLARDNEIQDPSILEQLQ